MTRTSPNPAAAVDHVLASDLLAAGECTATCLLAREPGGCGCRCRGAWHGALSAVRLIAIPQQPGTTPTTTERNPR